MTRKVKDRRTSERVEGGFEAAITTAGAPVEARVKNVSMSGLLVHSPKKVAEMTMVSMDLVLPGDRAESGGPAYSFRLTGAVVRCEASCYQDQDGFELAVFFTDMPQETRSALQEFIASRVG